MQSLLSSIYLCVILNLNNLRQELVAKCLKQGTKLVQAIADDLFVLPSTDDLDGPIIKLPPPTTRLPRSKPASFYLVCFTFKYYNKQYGPLHEHFSNATSSHIWLIIEVHMFTLQGRWSITITTNLPIIFRSLYVPGLGEKYLYPNHPVDCIFYESFILLYCSLPYMAPSSLLKSFFSIQEIGSYYSTKRNQCPVFLHVC